MRTWLPAISGMVCLGFGAGLISIYGFFVEPLAREFDVGVALVNMGPLALLLVPGIVAPRVGRLVDRLPIRRIILTGVTLSMASLCLVAIAPSLWLAGLAFLGFALGLTMYGPVVINGLMVKHYPGREARALAVVAMGISVATIILPPLVGGLLASLDWRQALAGLALALLLILWGNALVGIPAGIEGRPPAAQDDLEASIYRRREFWLIGICVALALNVSIILAICYPPYFTSRGYSVSEAGWFLSAAGVAGLGGKVMVAWLADSGGRYASRMAAGLLFFQALGLVLLLISDSAFQVIIALGVLGFSGGGFIPVHPYLNSRYFDPAIIGRVNGAQMPLFLPLGLVGPPLAGYVFDRTSSYDLVFMALIVVVSIAAVLALLLPPGRE